MIQTPMQRLRRGVSASQEQRHEHVSQIFVGQIGKTQEIRQHVVTVRFVSFSRFLLFRQIAIGNVIEETLIAAYAS